MELNFKRIISGILGITMSICSIPSIPSNAEEQYPYMMFAGSSIDGAITLNTNTVCINGNIATNGTIASTASNFNVNGTSTEHVGEEMIYFFDKLDSEYFNINNTEIYLTDYYLEEQNININDPVLAEGDVELIGNINISSGLKALDTITLSGNVENNSNAVVCSQTGDIIIDTDNVNLNGLIYAPEGSITINAQNLNINGVVMIADTINITCPNLNANYSTKMAEFIGTSSKSDNNDNDNKLEIELNVVSYAEYLEELNTIDIGWCTTVPEGDFEIQFSDDNDNYLTIATVSNTDSYLYEIVEDFDRKYIRIIETTNDGEVFITTPFILERINDGYEMKLLDSDEDGLPDILEELIGTDQYSVDTDEDGLTDYQEYYITNTNQSVYYSVIEGVSDADHDCDEDSI
ncbi:MAG: hypothetical protein K2K06_02610, partial [Oscillospiraceae bacterium]|nr:hypothetical protein [Oscillospiraceae bacterium]